MTVIVAVHFTPRLGQVEANRQALVELTGGAARGADLVVLPELATTGFALAPDEAETLSEELDGPTVAALAPVAREHGCVVVVGLALRSPAGLVNAQVVLDADGAVAGHYAKHHLYGADHDWATPGPTPGAVVPTRIGPLGLLICHDLAYPATIRAVARQAPVALAFSTAWIGDGSPIPREWLVAVRLLEGAPLVAANRGGAERGLTFDDPSLVLGLTDGGAVGPRGPGPHLVRAEL